MSEFSTRAGGLAEVRPKVPRADLSPIRIHSVNRGSVAKADITCSAVSEIQLEARHGGKRNAGDDLSASGRHPWSLYNEELSGCAVHAVVVGMESARAHARAHPELAVIVFDATRFESGADHELAVVLLDSGSSQRRP
jgi:hypothetical protein